ncbi:GntR family transcriptional regulator [Microcella humidisoli]|uniref:GntR family transcriptional regulator n=1 Tax=Microcella humidisoli TaxID=2963406 RepID=A0ABY5FZD1_9MICO|nr:GntR family transcriptional regulator [Microcella humidisoli]UTT63685.1 GntR family transcriptional regulator [Microcella humidisoli]
MYEQIESSLRHRIASGELQPLSRIESETEIAESFSVSRMTARKAIETLVRDGLLFRRQGKGTYVADLRIPYGLSTQLSFSTAMSSAGHDIRTEVVEAAIDRADADIAAALGVAPGSVVVHVSRVRLVDGAPAALHESWLPASLVAVLDYSLSESLNALMADLGHEVSTTQDYVEAVVCDESIAELLQCAPGSPMIKVSGVGFGSASNPLRFTRAHYRGDRFRFSLASGDSHDIKLEIKSSAD